MKTAAEIAGLRVDPNIMGGEPCIKGTRIPPRCVSSLAKHGYTVEAIRDEYPTLTYKQIAVALAWELRPAKARRAILAGRSGE